MMKLIDNPCYTADLQKAIYNIDLSSLDGKTVCITGGLGLIGSAIADLLLEYGKVRNIYILASSKTRFQRRYGEHKGISFIQYDALSTFPSMETPDYIIHCAGIANPQMYVSKPVETIFTNIDGIHQILEFASKNAVRRVLYVSSSEVYGRKKDDESFREGEYGVIDYNNIRSSYPVAKRASEMICLAYCYQQGVDVVIARPGHIYGPTASIYDKRISSEFAFKASKGECLILKSTGLDRRSYCYCVDCAVQLLTILINGVNGEAYNIGSSNVITIREMAEIYANAGNVTLEIADPTEEELKIFNKMRNSSLDTRKIRSLGYQDIFSIEEGLTHTVQILAELDINEIDSGVWWRILNTLFVKDFRYYIKENQYRLDVRLGLLGYAKMQGRCIVSWGDKIDMDLNYVEHIYSVGKVKLFDKQENILSETSATMEDFEKYGLAKRTLNNF